MTLARLLRVLTANLWGGHADARAFAELVEEAGADVVAVQELGPEQAEALAARLPHGRLHPARGHDGMGIALRRPGSVHRVTLPRRDALVAELATDAWPELGVNVSVINAHLLAPHAPPWWRTARIRARQLRGLETHLEASGAGPRLLVGDLNATPLWPAYRRLAAHLEDAALLFARRHARRPLRTWGPWPGAPRLLRIDHALVAGMEVEALRVVPVRGSDHSALLVEVSVPREEPER